MKKLQPQLEDFHSPVRPPSSGSKMLMTFIASGLVGACSTPPERQTITQYIPVYKEPIYIPSYRDPTLIRKVHKGNGPLGDKICELTYDTQEKIVRLCVTKEPLVVRNYSKVIPASTVTIPGKSTYIPGKTEYGYGYGIGMDGKYGYGYRLQNTPPKTEYSMPRIELRPAKTVPCREIKPFNQKDGSALPHIEQCFS